MSAAGQLLAGRYRLISRLGSGSMGVVWHAMDERLDRQVAVKQILLPPGLDPTRLQEARNRAMREARIAARLHHPNAVAVHDVAVDEGLPLLVMEYVPAHTLAETMQRHGRLDPVVVARIGAQVASALSAAHAAGIVHRDIKPGNILITEDGTAKLTDFGISHAAGDIAVTQTGLLAGTPAFLAPEIARGQRPTPSSDVFSLGATLYAATEGAPPFGENTDNQIALLHVVAEGRVRPPEHAGALEGVLAGMLAADPAARPDALRSVEVLRSVAGGHPPVQLGEWPTARLATTGPGGTLLDARPVTGTGLPATSAPHGAPPARRRRWIVPLVAGLFAVLLVAAVLVATLGGEKDVAQKPAPPVLTAAAMERAVGEYYQLLPRRTGRAWNRLGPRLRRQGQVRYQQFWGRVERIAIISAPRATGAKTVHVGVELFMRDGSRVREFHQLGMIAHRVRPLIGSDTVLHAETIAPPPPEPKREDKRGKGEDEKEGDGDKKGDDKDGDDKEGAGDGDKKDDEED